MMDEVIVVQADWVEEGERRSYEIASRHFPEDLHRTDKRGGVDIMYLEGETIISRLNEAFVYGWDFEILEDGINEDADECWARGRMTIWRKVTERTVVVTEDVDGEDKKITRRVTTHVERLVPVRREQYGSQKIKRARSSGKPLDIGFDLKGAGTDCLKKCASLHGVALYLWNKEERAMMEHAMAEMQEEKRQNGDGQQGEGQQKRFNRLGNRPSGGKTEGNGQQGGQGTQPRQIKINGIEMPLGFAMPFQLVMTGRGENDCHAKDCVEGINPSDNYNIGSGEPKPGTYVLKRSNEEAGCTLCVQHTGIWVRAKQMAKQATANQAA